MKSKKIISSVMAAALTLALTVPVMADTSPVTIDTETGSASIDAMMDISKAAASDTGEADYYISISWTTTTGTYTVAGDRYAWDGSTKSYVRNYQGSVTGTAATASITIKNQSNKNIDYEIEYANYAGTTQTVTAETTTSGSKTGTLKAYTTVNSLDIASDSSGAASVGYSGSEYTTPSATYKASIALRTGYQSSSHSKKQVQLGTYTVNVSRHVSAASRTLEYHKSTTLASDELLETASDAVTYTKNGSTVMLYQGYISATAYADWYDAKAFIDELNGEGTNTTKILPEGVTDASSGYWRLITWGECVKLDWESDGNIDGIHYIWGGSETDEEDEQTGVFFVDIEVDEETGDITCIAEDDALMNKDSTNSGLGFVVVWDEDV